MSGWIHQGRIKFGAVCGVCLAPPEPNQWKL